MCYDRDAMTAAPIINHIVGLSWINWLGFALFLSYAVFAFGNVPTNPDLAFAIFVAGMVLGSWPRVRPFSYGFAILGVLMITRLFSRGLEWYVVNRMHMPVEGVYHPHYDAAVRMEPVYGGVFLVLGLLCFFLPIKKDPSI